MDLCDVGLFWIYRQCYSLREILLSSPSKTFQPPRHCTPGTSRSLDRHISFTIYFLFAFMVPLLFLILSYSRTTLFLWRKTKATGAINRNTARAKLRSIKLFGIVFLSFLLSWGLILTLDWVQGGLRFWKRWPCSTYIYCNINKLLEGNVK